MGTDYQKQGNDFLSITRTEMGIKLLGHFPYWEDEKDSRDVYEITLTREGRKPFIFKFGQSLANSGVPSMFGVRTIADKEKAEERARKDKKKPSSYDVLTSLTTYDPGTFENFCADYGYDTDSRKAEKTYFAVQKEHSEVVRLFVDVMEQLQEIQ